MTNMGEKGPRSPETSLITTSWEKITNAAAFLKRHAHETRETGQELMKYPEVKEGSEAAFRAALNVAISCADIVPGAGELASWGADALKIIEEVRHRSKQKEAIERGEDPTKVKREKYNLTPDVSVYITTLTEALEFITFFTAPTHAIETVGQLWFDAPRMYTGIKKAREALVKIRARRERARKAAAQYDTSAFMNEMSDLFEGDDSEG